MVDDAFVETFIRDGAVRLAGAVPTGIVDECRALLWQASGCDEHDRRSWTRPVIRIDYRDDPPFAAAAATPALVEAFDALVGAGRWLPRRSLGTFPLRFPSDENPGDTGWHIESTGTGADGRAVVDPRSTERTLLLLYLFTDVDALDGPTVLRAGSQRDAARILFDGPGPVRDFVEVSGEIERATRHRTEQFATGRAGDVWICHPFVLHRAQPIRGDRARFIAQPPLPGVHPLDPRRPGDRSAVERAMDWMS